MDIDKKNKWGQGWKSEKKNGYLTIKPIGKDGIELTVKLSKKQKVSDVIEKIKDLLNEKTFEV